MAVTRHPAATTAHLLSLAIYCATASGFLLPAAFWRSNFGVKQPCSSTTSRYPWPFSTPTERTNTGNTVIQMLGGDEAGEQQREDEELRRQEREERATFTTAPILPQTLGNGRYVVRSVLGTGSTASTYRCIALPPPPPQQAPQDQGRPEDGVVKKRLETGTGAPGLLVSLRLPFGRGRNSKQYATEGCIMPPSFNVYCRPHVVSSVSSSKGCD